ncbi:MAG: hypothetical protein IJ435_04910 [Clostridia bacterium]|nr:hypothetical protein [Clostridia bacterium]
MLNCSVIEACIPIEVEKFKKKFPNSYVPQIVVCPQEGRAQFRKKVYDECGAKKTKDIASTAGEVIAGTKGIQIIIYQRAMINAEVVQRTVWHELGHVKVGIPEKYGIDDSEESFTTNGYKIVSEFLADYIAYVVNDGNAFSYLDKPQVYMTEAFDKSTGDYVYKDSLVKAMAMIIGIKDVDQETVLKEAFGVPSFVVYLLDTLRKQTEKPEFWELDIEFFMEIGNLYIELRDSAVRQSRLRGILGR